MGKTRVKIVCLGFPRSGTKSMSKILNLGHEKENENGISDWRLAFTDIECDRLVHVVRNPIDVISSNVLTISVDSLLFIRKAAQIGRKSILSTIVEGLIKWTEKIESLNPDEIVRIEDKDVKANGRYHAKLKWNDLNGIPIELQNKIKEIAIKYDYDPND